MLLLAYRAVMQIKIGFDTGHLAARGKRHVGSMIKRLPLAALGSIAGLCLCMLQDTAASAQTPPSSPAPLVQSEDAQGEEQLPLHVPYRGLMVALIDWSAYGIFSLAGKDGPISDEDWTAAGLAAVNLIAAATLLTMRNSNDDDHRRLADPAWLGMAADLQNASIFVAIAIETRDRSDFRRTADMLAKTCQSCHDKFRALPPNDTSRFAVR